jgi:hypothetical protein
VSVLPFLDLLFLKVDVGKRATPRWWGFVGASVFCLGDHEQTFHGNVARRACALCLVARERANSMARHREPYSVR